jgi:hypothetical protein
MYNKVREATGGVCPARQLDSYPATQLVTTGWQLLHGYYCMASTAWLVNWHCSHAPNNILAMFRVDHFEEELGVVLNHIQFEIQVVKARFEFIFFPV